jgi:N-methylhydantoinase A
VIIPLSATVYSAFGAAASDIHHSLQRSIRTSDETDLDAIASIYASIEGEARELLRRQEVGEEHMHLSRWAEIRYERQLHDVRVLVSSDPIGPGFRDTLERAFEERYVALYGPQSVLPDGRLKILRLGVEATGLIAKPAFPTFDRDQSDSRRAERPSRDIYWSEVGQWINSRIWDGVLLQPGDRLMGPGVIELPGTTIALPPDVEAEIDSRKSTVITFGQPGPTG